MTPEEINSILVIPEWDTSSPVKTDEAGYIYNFLREKRLSRTLETGFAFGKSAAHIMAATGSEHFAIDPFQERYKHLGTGNIEKLGMSQQLNLYHDYSHNVLPLLLNEKRKFEFVFIDGDHKFDGIMLDFYYTDLLLVTGGYIMFHDSWMRSTRIVEKFIRTNRSNYTRIPVNLGNLLLFQKIGPDTRDGMFFREFYTFRSLLLHSLIRWFSSPGMAFLKRSLYKLKGIFKG